MKKEHNPEELWDWISSNIGFDKKEILDGIKEFVRLKIAEREHDHEILVNTILDTKNKELEARDEKWETAVRYNVDGETWKRIERAIKALKN